METFELKTKVYFGEHALNFMSVWKDKKVFIVTDPFIVDSGMIRVVTDQLQVSNYSIFKDIVPDPPIEIVIQGVQEVIKFHPEAVLAIGGGSAIDAAKAIMYFSKKIGNLQEMSFIAVPTTSGTGSEVTSFAVITNPQKGIKYPLVSDELLPDVAILESDLVKSVPSAIVADTGMDVLTHAIEAYVSTKANDFSDALAEKSVQLVFEYLLRSYKSNDDKEAKEKMHHASCIAGMAFNYASLGFNHALAHNIGGKLHIPHGRTNAILLPYVIEYNADINEFSPKTYNIAALKYEKLAKLLGIAGSTTRLSVKAFIQEIRKLQRALNMPIRLSDCKVSEEEIKNQSKKIAQGALQDACMITNPKQPTLGEIVELLYKVK